MKDLTIIGAGPVGLYASIYASIRQLSVNLVESMNMVGGQLTALYGDKYIYDIETGSLVTAPCPIRYCSIKNNQFSCESVTIVDKIYPNTDFAQNATAFVKKTVAIEAKNILKGYYLSDKDADYIADMVGDAFVAHYSGDEDIARRIPLDERRLSLWGRIVE